MRVGGGGGKGKDLSLYWEGKCVGAWCRGTEFVGCFAHCADDRIGAVNGDPSRHWRDVETETFSSTKEKRQQPRCLFVAESQMESFFSASISMFSRSRNFTFPKYFARCLNVLSFGQFRHPIIIISSTCANSKAAKSPSATCFARDSSISARDL